MNLNVYIDMFALLVVLSVWLYGIAEDRLGKHTRPLFTVLLIVIVLILLSDIFAWTYDGQTFSGAKEVLKILNTIYYTLQIVYCYCWVLFAILWRKENASVNSLFLRTRHRISVVSLAIPMVVELGLIFANIWNGWIFTIDANNLYQRGDYYLANLIPYYLYIASAVFIALYGTVKGKSDKRRENASFLVFMILPIVGTIVETFTYGVSWLWPFSAISLMLVYLDIHKKAMISEHIQAEKIEQDAHVSIMLSQIQPHFLYNSLTAIYGLCDSNPALAQETIGNFSRYLRYNMDSLQNKHPIMFSEELSHIKTYAELEKMRFGPLLDVEYDIQCDAFALPSLCVQPLVENAVKHGVGKSAKGGVVRISTREDSDYYIVVVDDDGVGFEMNNDRTVTEETGERSHVGIENVRTRLAKMTNATLEIVSEKNVGTIATIKIPKERNIINENYCS